MKLRKALVSLLLAAALVLSLGTMALADTAKEVTIYFRGISIVINGALINPCDAAGNPVEPFILDGTTYLPVRAVANALGLQVGWDNATSTVTLDQGGLVNYGNPYTEQPSTSSVLDVTITYRDIKLVIDGTRVVPTDAAGNPVEPFILDGTTYLPVRAVSNALGLEVGWNDATSTVTLGEAEAWGVWQLAKATSTTYYYDGGMDQEIRAYTYDAWANLLSESYTSSDPGDWSRTVYTYDAYDNVLTEQYSSPYYSYSSVYAYDVWGNQISDYTVYDDGSTYTVVRAFDSNNNCISYVENGVATTFTYTYDANDNVVKETCTYGDGTTYTTIYDWDANGDVVKITNYDDDGVSGVTTYVRDANGDVLKWSFVSSDGTSYTNTYTYQADGSMVETYRCTYSDGGFYSTTTVYDANGDTVTEEEIYTNGSSMTTHIYDSDRNWLGYRCTYDDGSWYAFERELEDGRVVSESSSYSGGSTYRTLYEYDANGNVVEETCYFNSGYTITTNEYTYITIAAVG